VSEVECLQNALEDAQKSVNDATIMRIEMSAENDAIQKEILTHQSNVTQITAAKDAELMDLHHELDSVQKLLADAEGNTQMLTEALEALECK